MDVNNLSINVKCGLTVDDRTALTCLKLLEVYMNSNPDKEVIEERLRDGSVEFRIMNLYKGKEEVSE